MLRCNNDACALSTSKVNLDFEPIQTGHPMPLPILALAIASFCIGTTEFVIMG
ncbi:MAG: MFS transporter, partial [Mesorhizobium sp.]